jgi:hypothetical protein
VNRRLQTGVATRRPLEGVTVAAVNDDGLGFKFFVKLAGIVIACGLVGLILFLLLSKAIYAWGFLGGFLAFALLLLAVGWVWDRRGERWNRDDSGSA